MIKYEGLDIHLKGIRKHYNTIQYEYNTIRTPYLIIFIQLSQGQVWLTTC